MKYKGLTWLSALLFFFTLWVYYTAGSNPVECNWCAPTSFFIPLLLILHIFLCLLLAFLQPYATVFPTLSILLGYKYVFATVSIGALFTPSDVKPDLTVLSYNVRVFNSYQHLRSDADYNSSLKIMDAILESQADVVCLQEFYEDPKSKIFNTVKRLQKVYPYYYQTGNFKNKYGQSFGLATFSKYKITGKGVIKFGNKTKNHGSFIKIQLKNETVTIFNLHLQSMHIDEDQLTDSEWSVEYGKSLRNVLLKLSNGMAERAEQWQTVESYVNPQEYTLVCGDFNETPYGYLYQNVIKKYTNSFEKAGLGIGATYNGVLPLLRIDHQFHSSNIVCTQAEVHSKTAFTDHFPLKCGYVLNEKSLVSTSKQMD